MPIDRDFGLEIAFPGLSEEDRPDQIVIKPNPEPLAQRGPVLDVELHVTDEHAKILKDNDREVPSPQTGKGLIDTGASVSAVDVDTIQDLELSPIGAINVGTPSGKDTQELYALKFSFPGKGLPDIPSLNVLGSNLGGQNICALIGRDILRYCLIDYEGTSGSVTIAI